MHPALRSRIRGYGYEVYVNTDMKDTERNRRKLSASSPRRWERGQEDTGRAIPHFDRPAIGMILKEAQRRSGRREVL